jgi:sporulation protein YlmC with PRC-barrel domain
MRKSMMKFTKPILLAGTSAIAILAAAPVWAAQQNPASTMVELNTASQIKAEDLIGKNITNLRGDKVGEIESVIIDDKGKVAGVIVGIGGFLGMGERHVAMDWDRLLIRDNGKLVQTNSTKTELKALPEYKYEKAENQGKAFFDRSYFDGRPKSDAGANAKAEWIPSKALRTSKLIGANVVNTKGEAIGEVEDVILSDGQPEMILTVGEFLGMGGRFVKLDMEKAKVHRQRGDADHLRVAVSMTKEELMAQPKFSPDMWKKSKGLAK